MKQTYKEAIAKVFKDEGGYSNIAADPGGPTNWGITLADAKKYWKEEATAEDVKTMPKQVAEDIYAKHYALPLKYDDLPAGVDYAVLDYGINSGIGRVRKVYANVTKETLDPKQIINKIYDEREAFLRSLKTFPTFGRGWIRRTVEGRELALNLFNRYGLGKSPITHGAGTTAPIIVGTAVAASHWQDYMPYIIGGGMALAILTFILVRKLRKVYTDV